MLLVTFIGISKKSPPQLCLHIRTISIASSRDLLLHCSFIRMPCVLLRQCNLFFSKRFMQLVRLLKKLL
ncbi:unnamed protein product, partial [Arabidopsis halleri]